MIVDWESIEDMIGDDKAIERIDENFVPLFCPAHQKNGYLKYKNALLDPNSKKEKKNRNNRLVKKKQDDSANLIPFGQGSSNPIDLIEKAKVISKKSKATIKKPVEPIEQKAV